MSNREWEDFGEEIRKTIQRAVENQDYAKLNQTISDTISQAMDSVAKGVKNSANTSQTKYAGYKTYTTDFEKAKRKSQSMPVKQERVSFEMKPPSKVGAILSAALGYGVGIMAFVIFLVLLLAGNLAITEMAAGFHAGAGFFGIVSAGGIAAAAAGTKKLFRINRFKTYVKAIGNKEYCNISVLAAKVGKADKAVVKDLQYMIKNRWFGQGHLDSQKTCLIVTDQMYQQYKQLEERKLLEQKEAEEKAAALQQHNSQKEKMDGNLEPEVRQVIEKGEAYIQRIRACNDAIPGEEISAKIFRIEMLVEKIFDRVKKNPRSVSDIRKLMEYYLPTTVKLLEAYVQLDAQPAGGENIQSAKKEIEETLDTLNVAFEKLLDDLFRETAWDVSSDISVLNTMLAQEGLKEDGLKSKR